MSALDRTYKDANGLPHREDGPAIELDNGDKFWYFHGKIHRDNGPAIEGADGYEGWYRHHKLHRLGGPAVVFEDGSKSWNLDGTAYSEYGYWHALWEGYEVTAALWLAAYAAFLLDEGDGIHG